MGECEIFVYEFDRSSDREYELGLDDVAFFALSPSLLTGEGEYEEYEGSEDDGFETD